MTCACGRPATARALCVNCYHRALNHGSLADHERRNYTMAELLDEWARLRSEGHTRRQAAERLGISRDAIDKAIRRAAS